MKSYGFLNSARPLVAQSPSFRLSSSSEADRDKEVDTLFISDGSKFKVIRKSVIQ